MQQSQWIIHFGKPICSQPPIRNSDNNWAQTNIEKSAYFCKPIFKSIFSKFNKSNWYSARSQSSPHRKYRFEQSIKEIFKKQNQINNKFTEIKKKYWKILRKQSLFSHICITQFSDYVSFHRNENSLRLKFFLNLAKALMMSSPIAQLAYFLFHQK